MKLPANVEFRKRQTAGASRCVQHNAEASLITGYLETGSPGEMSAEQIDAYLTDNLRAAAVKLIEDIDAARAETTAPKPGDTTP